MVHSQETGVDPEVRRRDVWQAERGFWQQRRSVVIQTSLDLEFGGLVEQRLQPFGRQHDRSWQEFLQPIH